MENVGTQAAGATASEARLKASAARLSVAAAAFLIVLKTATGYLTGSISVWASLLDSTMDIFASVINYFAVRADRKSTRLNSSHANISYAVFCLKKKKKIQ